MPVTTRELLDLLEGLKQHIAFADMDDFYYFSRACMVKDEKYFDRFDRAFGLHFKDLEALDDVIEALIPDDWLRSEFLKNLSEEEKANVKVEDLKKVCVMLTYDVYGTVYIFDIMYLTVKTLIYCNI